MAREHYQVTFALSLQKCFVIFNNFLKRECYAILKSLASNFNGDGAGSQSVLELVRMREQTANERRDASNQRRAIFKSPKIGTF